MMQKNVIPVLFFHAMLIAACSTGKKPTGAGVSLIATAPVNPVLKGLDVNPILRIEVNISVNSKMVDYKSIQLSLNNSALSSLEKLDVYSTDTLSLFNSKNKIVTISSLAETVTIPVNLQLPPGKHYLWVSGSLKASARIDDIIEIHATSLSGGKRRKYNIIETGQNFRKRSGIVLRKGGVENVHTYRIPGIVTTDKGTLIAVYDIRYNNSKDLPENIDVGMSRSTDGGKTWEPMKTIMDMGVPHENNGIGDPAVLFDPVQKKIWVAALWSKGNRSIAGSEPGLSPDTSGQFVLTSSDDDGQTWSPPYNITAQVKNPMWHLYFQGPGSGIAMKNGTLVFASQYWDESKKPGIPHSSIIYSTDHGATWKSGIGAKSNTTESQVVETVPGTLMLNMRDNRGKFRSIATTTDMGKTWKEHPTSRNALPDPVCMAGFIKTVVNGKEILFFSNPSSSSGRYDMTIKASTDLGESWLPSNQLLIDHRICYGYSSLTRIDDNTLGLVYEGTGDLYFVRVPVSEILKQ
jgi:sialidase-1